MNQAFVFIKPHVIGNEKATSFIMKKFEENKISIVSSGSISGDTIKADSLIDKHYSVNAKVGTTLDPSELFLNDEAKETFKKEFGLSWDDAVSQNKVYSGVAAQKKYGDISGDELNKIWGSGEVKKVAGGLYVVHIEKDDIYMMNGFYPSIREVFTDSEAQIDYYMVDFDKTDLCWKDFRGKVIGATNPNAADPNSIRGFLCANQEKYGLKVSYRDNIIHASASPFEGLVEKLTWLEGFDFNTDPLGVKLAEKGYNGEKVLALRDENPVLTLKGYENEKLIDVLEDKDTQDVADIIFSLS